MTAGYFSPARELNALRVDSEVCIGALPAQAMPRSGVATSFGPGMPVVGNVVSTGPVNVSGRASRRAAPSTTTCWAEPRGGTICGGADAGFRAKSREFCTAGKRVMGSLGRETNKKAP